MLQCLPYGPWPVRRATVIPASQEAGPARRSIHAVRKISWNCLAGARRSFVICADCRNFQRKIAGGGNHGFIAAGPARPVERQVLTAFGLLAGSSGNRSSRRRNSSAGTSEPPGNPETARGRTSARRSFLRPPRPSRLDSNHLEGPLAPGSIPPLFASRDRLSCREVRTFATPIQDAQQDASRRENRGRRRDQQRRQRSSSAP